MIEGEAPGAPAGGSPGAGSPAAEPPAAESPVPGSTVAGAPTAGDAPQRSWFRMLLRLWCLKSADAEPRGNPLGAIIVLSVSCLSAWVAVDWWQRQPDPEFSIDGIPLLAWYVLGVVTLAALLGWRSRPRPAFVAMLVLALGAVPVPLLLVGVVAFYLRQPWVWWAGVAALYLCVFFMRGLSALTGRPQRSSALVGVLFVATFMW